MSRVKPAKIFMVRSLPMTSEMLRLSDPAPGSSSFEDVGDVHDGVLGVTRCSFGGAVAEEIRKEELCGGDGGLKGDGKEED